MTLRATAISSSHNDRSALYCHVRRSSAAATRSSASVRMPRAGRASTVMGMVADYSGGARSLRDSAWLDG